MPAESSFPRPWTFADKAKAGGDEFTVSKAAELEYERKLRSLAKNIKNMLLTAPPEAAEALLREYAEIIEPWARQSAVNMLAVVER
jgi:hypothetical protein